MVLQHVLEKYLNDDRQLARNTKRRFVYSLNRWKRLLGSDGTEHDFGEFRRRCLDAGLSPHSAEQTVRDIFTLLRYAGVEADIGRRLRCPPPAPRVPTIEEIDAVISCAESAQWPTRQAPGPWWRAYFATGLWTALRLRDLLGLTWDLVSSDLIRCRPQKTLRYGLDQEIPIHDAVARALQSLPKESEAVFAYQTSFKQMRREIARLCKLAKVPYFTPHDIRRAGVTMWSLAHPEAGRLIHGSGKRDIMKHYLSPIQILRAAAIKCRLPDSLLTPEEKDRVVRDELELVARFRLADPDQRNLILQLSGQIVRAPG
jgi:integrase